MNVSNYETVVTTLAQAMASQFKMMISDETIEVVPYEDSWANGTGYFDGLAREHVKTDDCGYRMFRSIDKAGRHILLVRSGEHQYVIFQRYSNSERQLIVHYSKHTRSMRIIGTSNWTDPTGTFLDALSVMDDLYQRAKREAARAD